MADCPRCSQAGSEGVERIPRVLNIWTTTKYSFLGVPLFLRFLPARWHDVRTPAFPIALPAIGSLVCATFLALGAGLSKHSSFSGHFPDQPWFWAVWYFSTAELNNIVFLLSCRGLLALRARLRNAPFVPVFHLQRTVYFSSVWQSVMLACWGVLWGSYGSRVGFPVILVGSAMLVMLMALSMRVLSMFFGLYRSNIGLAFSAAATCLALAAGAVVGVDVLSLGSFLMQAMLR